MNASPVPTLAWPAMTVAATALVATLLCAAVTVVRAEEPKSPPVSERVSETAGHAAAKVESAATHAAEATKSGFDKAVDATSRALDKAGQAIERAADKTGEAVERAIAKAKSTIAKK